MVERKVVVKQYGACPDSDDECKSFGLNDLGAVLPDLMELRQAVGSHVKIPEIYCFALVSETLGYIQALAGLVGEGWVYHNGAVPVLLEKLGLAALGIREELFRLVVVEQYAGVSVRDEISRNPDDCDNVAYEALSLVTAIPEGIWIDANPANVTKKDEEYCFVDFMPPKISEYQDVGRMEEIFPTIKRLSDRAEEKRRWQYLTKAGREDRFWYYVEKFRQQVKQV